LNYSFFFLCNKIRTLILLVEEFERASRIMTLISLFEKFEGVSRARLDCWSMTIKDGDATFPPKAVWSILFGGPSRILKVEH
jgi:hypothetical protein